MAFGDVAVDEIRPTDVLPGLSFLTGLLGNALGWTYTDGERLQRLQDRLRMASRLERRGILLRDYQNAHINKADKLWRFHGAPGKRSCGAAGESIVQRERYYRADAAVTVAFALEPSEEFPTPDDLVNALCRPKRPLFLGRMACPPSHPLYCGERRCVTTLEQALAVIPLMPYADPSPWLEETPGETATSGTELLERKDVRVWKNDVHAGSRLVIRRLRNSI